MMRMAASRPHELVKRGEVKTVNMLKNLNYMKRGYLSAFIRIPRKIFPKIKDVQQELKRADPRQIYHPPSFWHITVKLLNLESRLRASMPRVKSTIVEVLKGYAPFRVELRGLDMFPEAVYVHVSDRGKVLKRIHNDLKHRLHDLVEHYWFEGPGYTPHLTIASFRTNDISNLVDKMVELKSVKIGAFVAREIELMRGKRTKERDDVFPTSTFETIFKCRLGVAENCASGHAHTPLV